MKLSGRTKFALLSAVALTAGAAQAAPVQTLGNGNTLITVDSAAPGTILNSRAITGVAAGTRLSAIDYRPASPRVLYAISNVGQIYVINARTGVAVAVGTPPLPTISAIGFDFNPTVDRLRIITQVGQNVRANPDTGLLAATDGSLAYAATDPNFGQIPTAAGAAYTNNVPGATSTTLYVIDTRGGLQPARLVTQGSATVSPNTGSLFTVGSTGITTATSVGFDIGRDGIAFATLTNPTTLVTSLYSVNLTTGAATLIGAIGGNTTYDGLAIALAPFATMGATANQAAVGNALDQFTGVPSTATLALFNGIDGVFATPGAQSAALQQLSPAAYSLLPEISLTAVETSEAGVLRYAHSLRSGKAMVDGQSATLDAEGRFGIWLTGGSRLGKFDAAVDRYRTEIDDVHVLGGVDYRFTPTIAVGAFGGYSDLTARLVPGGGARGKLKSSFAGGYATVGVGPAHIDVWGSYTNLNWSLSRDIAFGSFVGATTAQTGGNVTAGGASAGLSFRAGRFEIAPFAAVRYADIKLNGFGELGGSVAALTVGNLNRQSVRSHVGAKAATSFETSGATIRPEAHGGWYHEFRNPTQTITANFSTGGAGIDTPFSFTATPLARDYYSAGGSLSVGGRGPLSMVAGYEAQLSRDRTIHEFTIGARFAF